MSIVTLNRYLLGQPKGSAGQSKEIPVENYLDLVSRTIAAIRRSVLCGETFVDLFEELDAMRKDLHVEISPEVANQCGCRMEDILSTYQKRLRQAEIDRAADLRNVLDMLQETLNCLMTGSQKNEGRQKNLENSLANAGRIDDISSLRSYLAKVLHSVREGGRQDSQEAKAVLERFGKQIQQVHKVHSRFNTELPGRVAAVEHLRKLWENTSPAANLHVALFIADSLKAVRERHGEEVATLILQDLGRKQIKELTPNGEVFGWSSNALLLIWQHSDESLPASEIASRLKQPCELRAFVGTRIAIFSLSLRSLVVQARESVAEMEAILDRFVRRSG